MPHLDASYSSPTQAQTLRERILQSVAALLTVGFAASGLILLYHGRWVQTRLDFWRIYGFCLSHSWWQSLITKSNGHSAIFPSLVWLPNLWWFHNNQELLFFAGTFVLLLTCGLILLPIWTDNSISLTERWAMTLIAVVGTLWMGRATITASGGFDLSNSLAVFGMLLSLTSLPRPDHPRIAPGRASVIIIGGIVASYSFASGLATWPTLIFIAWFLRLNRRWLALLLFTGIAVSVVYALLPGGLSLPRPHLTLSLVLSAIGPFFARLCLLIGAPVLYAKAACFSEQISSNAAAFSLTSLCSGSVGLLLACCFIGEQMVRRTLAEVNARAVGLGLMIFTIGALVLIIAGRTLDFSLHPTEVSATRYLFWTSLFWAGLIICALQWGAPSPKLRGVLLVVCLAVPFLVYPEHVRQGRNARFVFYLANTASTSLINGVRDLEMIRFLSGKPDEVYALAPAFRRLRLDMFASGASEWLGRPISRVSEKRSHRASPHGALQVDALLTADDGKVAARFEGWALEDGHKKKIPNYLLVIDSKGTICGIGRPTIPRPDINQANHLPSASPSGFTGYIRNYDPAIHYSAYSMRKGAISTGTIAIAPPNK